ncbi:MAG: signal recognition particle protein [Cytophagales bacterium]|nr:MAG: signal recognition particle protein [Cytophagales bacterium]
MFKTLSNRLDKAMKTLKGQGRITDVNIAATMKEIRKALMEADVNYKVAKEITDKIKDEAIGRKVMIDVKPGELLVKIVHEQLMQLMGGTTAEMNLRSDPAVILMTGLQGSGKTTFSAKLANYLKKQGRQVLLVACDVYRPAAIEQLKVNGQAIGVEVYSEPENKNPIAIAQNSIKWAKENNKKIIIIDTAGRLAVDEAMMTEIAQIKTAIQPSEILFVVDAMTGQDAVNTAKSFNDRVNFDGVVLTKLDGDTRGGAALSIRNVVEKPIKFISTGEKVNEPNSFDIFNPDSIARRILNMGDVLKLVEIAQDAFDQQEMEKLNKKLRKNEFDFNDFYSQIQQIKKMGNLKDIISMIPGMGKMLKEVEIDDFSLTPIEAIIQSMTPKERNNPILIDGSRKKRIANGSGTSVQQVNNLIKQFQEMRKMIKKMNDSKGKRFLPNINPFR